CRIRRAGRPDVRLLQGYSLMILAMRRTCAGQEAPQAGVQPITFYDELITETAGVRAEFVSIPLIERALHGAASAALYPDFLAQAFHHVRQPRSHTGAAAGIAGTVVHDHAARQAGKDRRQGPPW